MAKRSNTATRLRPPFLKRVWLDESAVHDRVTYPFSLPFLKGEFEIRFSKPVTIIVGENGVGKSTLVEALAAFAGYDDAGGGQGYRPLDHAGAVETSGGRLKSALRAAWLPKVTRGWFFKAETFFTVARYLDRAAIEGGGAPPDFLSHSHGEGFMRFFEERCLKQGLYLFDEPESALSPIRQVEFLKLLRSMQEAENSQVIMATHSPLLMALPDADLLRMTRSGLEPIALEETDHFRLLQRFFRQPSSFIREELGP